MDHRTHWVITASTIISVAIASAASYAATLVNYDFTLANPGQVHDSESFGSGDSTPFAPAASAPAGMVASGVAASVFGVAGSTLTTGSAPGSGNISNTSSPSISFRTGVHHYLAGTYRTFVSGQPNATAEFAASADRSTSNGESGYFNVTGSGSLGATGATPDISASNTRWIGFSVSSPGDTTLSLSALSFYSVFASNGSGYGTLCYSINGGVWNPLNVAAGDHTVANVFRAGNAWSQYSYDLSGIADIQGVAGEIAFRWYLSANTTSGSRSFKFDDVAVEGSIHAAAIPEPAGIALLTLGALSCLARRRG